MLQNGCYRKKKTKVYESYEFFMYGVRRTLENTRRWDLYCLTAASTSFPAILFCSHYFSFAVLQSPCMEKVAESLPTTTFFVVIVFGYYIFQSFWDVSRGEFFTIERECQRPQPYSYM